MAYVPPSFDDASSSSSVGGTEVYQPPECFGEGEVVFGAVDAWGLGCVLFEMATSQSLPTDPPFLGQLLLEADHAKHSKNIAEKFGASVAAADYADGNYRDAIVCLERGLDAGVSWAGAAMKTEKTKFTTRMPIAM